jgi:sulfite exporter TauE/SafE
VTLGLSPESGLALVASTALVGSVHCVGMCGGLVLACAPDRGHSAWQAGRLVAYVALGALAGALGHGLTQLGEALLDVQRGAGVVLGGVLVALAVHTLWPRAKVVVVTARGRPGWPDRPPRPGRRA